MSIIDKNGYRENVGIILMNDNRRLFWGRRQGQNAWQFPQGGVLQNESPEEAMLRELYEEVGLQAGDVRILSSTKSWLRYRLPEQFVRQNSVPLCIGQKQKWFLLKLMGADDKVSLLHTPAPEFDNWRWVSYWYPVNHVIDFKKDVYKRALKEFAYTVFSAHSVEGTK